MWCWPHRVVADTLDFQNGFRYIGGLVATFNGVVGVLRQHHGANLDLIDGDSLLRAVVGRCSVQRDVRAGDVSGNHRDRIAGHKVAVTAIAELHPQRFAVAHIGDLRHSVRVGISLGIRILHSPASGQGTYGESVMCRAVIGGIVGSDCVFQGVLEVAVRRGFIGGKLD